MPFVTAPAYTPKTEIRVVTAASLFDGHDAGICPERSRRINIMWRIIQATGAEEIHLGYDSSMEDMSLRIIL